MTDYLSERELDLLRAKATNARDWLLIETQYQTGCTVSELINLQRTDIKQRSITISERTCHVSQYLIERLRAYTHTHHGEYIFPSRQQPQLTQKRVQQIIKGYLKQLPLKHINKATPHLLRYTHVIHATKKGVPFNAIKAQTGLGELRLSQIISGADHDAHDAYGRMFG